ncbi:homoserine kinase [Virgibacillus kekensis]|uniref:Homoserine kinase n=1 Tax=Virgibacillus kekensis TaxID=202261 RepID=A0ABV9DFW4_9BACI
MSPLRITVPASSANIGPGFDSVGVAVSCFLILDVSEQDRWEIRHKSSHLPTFAEYTDHFIYQIARRTAEYHNKELPACKVLVTSEIPLARGFGSSASAALAGIELANQLCDLNLSDSQKLKYGTEIEGHPDNIAPALFGGLMVTAVSHDDQVEYISVPGPELDLIAYIPETELKTEEARRILPENYSRGQAARASSVGNLMIASLLQGDYQLAGRMIELDSFHEPYRAPYIPNYQIIRREASQLGAYGSAISGAGPTMVSFAPKGYGPRIAKHMTTLLPEYKVMPIKIDSKGLQVERVNLQNTIVAE